MASQSRDAQITSSFLSHGKIGSDDLKTALSELGFYPSETQLVSLYLSADTDYSGILRFPEFKVMVGKLMQEAENYQRNMMILKGIDSNNTGFLEKHEIRGFLLAHKYVITDDVLDNIFVTVDANGDGRVNYLEFMNEMKRIGLLL